MVSLQRKYGLKCNGRGVDWTKQTSGERLSSAAAGFEDSAYSAGNKLKLFSLENLWKMLEMLCPFLTKWNKKLENYKIG